MSEKFGKGKAGRTAMEIVASENCKVCSEPAVQTVDFDLSGELWQIPACASHVCLENIRQMVLIEMRRKNQIDTHNTFSINGLGRA